MPDQSRSGRPFPMRTHFWAVHKARTEGSSLVAEFIGISADQLSLVPAARPRPD